MEYATVSVGRPALTTTPCVRDQHYYLSTKMKSAKAGKPVPPASENDADLAVSLKLWVVLARASAAVGAQVDTNIAKNDLTTAEFGILEVLLHKGPLLLGEIQRKILVTSGGITYLVDRLAEKGLVKREECPNDRRARYAVLTPAGDALIRRLFPDHARRVAQVVSGLTMREQAEAIKLLRQLGLSASALPNE